MWLKPWRNAAVEIQPLTLNCAWASKSNLSREEWCTIVCRDWCLNTATRLVWPHAKHLKNKRLGLCFIAAECACYKVQRIIYNCQIFIWPYMFAKEGRKTSYGTFPRGKHFQSHIYVIHFSASPPTSPRTVSDCIFWFRYIQQQVHLWIYCCGEEDKYATWGWLPIAAQERSPCK